MVYVFLFLLNYYYYREMTLINAARQAAGFGVTTAQW
jgi:hypothetical protein